MRITNDTLEYKFEGEDFIEFAEDIEEGKLLSALKQLYIYEDESRTSLPLRIKTLPTELKIVIINHALKYENLVNSSVILNIFNLIKGYNTFEDEYFEHEDVFFTTLEEYLDVKIDLNRELSTFSKQLIFYYLSIMRSCGVVEFTNDSMPVDIPVIYQRFLSVADFVTLSNIFMKVPEINTNDLILVNDAYQYVSAWASGFAFANKMMEMFLNGNQSK